MTKLNALLAIVFALAFNAFASDPISNLQFSPDDHYDVGTMSNRAHAVHTGTGGIWINKAQLYHAQVSLAASDINGMYAAPVQLVAAVSGRTIAVDKLEFTITRTSTAFASGGAAIVQYANTANGGGTQALDSTLASTVFTGSAGTSFSLRNGAVISDSATLQGLGLFISNATGAFTTGTGTAVVDIWYYLI